jgi:hypothetical protein
MSVKSEAWVTIYEVGGRDVAEHSATLRLSSHWNRGELVVLKSPGDGESITVLARDLREALSRVSE